MKMVVKIITMGREADRVGEASHTPESRSRLSLAGNSKQQETCLTGTEKRGSRDHVHACSWIGVDSRCLWPIAICLSEKNMEDAISLARMVVGLVQETRRAPLKEMSYHLENPTKVHYGWRLEPCVRWRVIWSRKLIRSLGLSISSMPK
ncbi:unnamed protein product [Linum trigynum]|uniref:Uncharacterized protein n=2 Tax=Linum trigynum TaxID=586398 RepID=A0AAV2FFT4_9ROSI